VRWPAPSEKPHPWLASPDLEERWFGTHETQRVHVEGTLKLLGLTESSTSKEREIVSRILGVSSLFSVLQLIAAVVLTSPLTSISTVACSILERIRPSKSSFRKLVSLGELQKFWGRMVLFQQPAPTR
jgi:hypothetical protein